MNNLTYYVGLQKEHYTWKNALLWGNCSAHYLQATMTNRYSHYVMALITAIPLISQVVSIFEKVVVSKFVQFPKISSIDLTCRQIKQIYRGRFGTYQNLTDAYPNYPSVMTDAFKKNLPQANVLDLNSHIFMGSYPGDKDPMIAQQKIDFLTRILRVDTFVGLLDGSRKGNVYYDHGGAKQFARYDILIAGKKPTLLDLPIPDNNVTSDEEVLNFLNNKLLPAAIRAKEDGHAIYIHCWGGHGRTGTIAAILMGILYGLTSEEALEHVEKVHKMRLNPKDAFGVLQSCPQEKVQKDQVRRILELITKQV